MNELEKIWLACAIDGEGSIGFQRYKQIYNVYIDVNNSNLKFVNKAQEITDTGHIICFRKPKRLPMYSWRVKKAGDCYWILSAILPYLIIKHEVAERALLYLRFRKQKGSHTRHGAIEKTLVEGNQSEIEDIRQMF